MFSISILASIKPKPVRTHQKYPNFLFRYVERVSTYPQRYHHARETSQIVDFFYAQLNKLRWSERFVSPNVICTLLRELTLPYESKDPL
jgi:hypothetical protein